MGLSSKVDISSKVFMMAIGIFDSGLGGLTVLDAVTKKMPAESFVYMGDNLHAPYGVRDSSKVYDLTIKCIERMWDEDCDLIILACNTASAAALKKIQEEWLPKKQKSIRCFCPTNRKFNQKKLGRQFSTSGG